MIMACGWESPLLRAQKPYRVRSDKLSDLAGSKVYLAERQGTPAAAACDQVEKKIFPAKLS